MPVFTIICLLCFALNVNGQNITISPSDITVDLIGGDTITRNLTFSYNGASETTCSISFIILPEGEGINVSFSVDDSFVMPPGDTVIQITVNVSDSIMPGTYTISICADAEETVSDSGKTKSSYTPYSGPIITIQDPVDELPVSDPPVDETPDNTLLLDDNPSSSYQPIHFSLIVFIVMLVTTIVTLLIIYGIRRRKNKNEK